MKKINKNETSTLDDDDDVIKEDRREEIKQGNG